MSAPSYDPTIIESEATRLYSQAGALVKKYALFGLFFGLLIGLVFCAFAMPAAQSPGPYYDRSSPFEQFWPTLVFIAIGGILGASAGRTKGQTLRLSAQTALCQVQIEKHLKRIASPSAASDERG